jgi:hypothetical protein
MAKKTDRSIELQDELLKQLADNARKKSCKKNVKNLTT